MIEAIFTIVGTIVGFALSELATIIREGRSEKRQSKSVKTIVKLEMELNLQMLREFWSRVTQFSEPEVDPDTRKRSLARQFFIEVPFPVFKREALESQLPLLAGALHEQEVVRVFQFYDHLSKLKLIESKLTTSMHEQREETRAATAPGSSGGLGQVLAYYPPMPFDDSAPNLWDECERLVTQLLNEGNPLEPP